MIYPNAFTGFKADLVCTYRRSGFECDLVFRQQPPAPDQYGLDDSFSTIQLVTEFFDTADPQQVPAAENSDYGLQDSTLKFGAMTMTRGKAFAASSTNSQPSTFNSSTAVYKRWLHNEGRTFLIEEVPLAYLADALSTLPLTASIQKPASRIPYLASSRRVFPPAHKSISDNNQILIASAGFNQKPGVVLDYCTVDSDHTDFTFHNGTTYFISSTVYISGTTTFEGGAVVKFPEDGDGTLYGATVVCDTTPYSPAVFTSENDNSFGDSLPWSSGSPAQSGYNFFEDGDVFELDYCQFYYAGTAVATSADTTTVNGCQFFQCCYAIVGGDIVVNNTLASGCNYFLDAGGACENCTFDQCAGICDNDTGFTNCIFSSVTAVGYAYYDPTLIVDGSNNGFYDSPEFGDVQIAFDGNYQTGPLGNYYLSSDSTAIDAGNITADTLGLYWFTTQTSQAIEGTSPVDLGYHYLALDGEGNPVEPAIPADHLPPNGYWNPGVIGTNGTTYRQNGYFIPPIKFPYTYTITGTVGDGVADDTAAIQAGINAGEALGACVVNLPAGKYKITSPLVLGDTGYPNNPLQVDLRGAGPTNTFILNYCGLLQPCIKGNGGGPLVDGSIQTVITNIVLRGTSLLHIQTWNSLFANPNLWVGYVWQANSTCCTNNDRAAYIFGTTNLQAYEDTSHEQMFRVVAVDGANNNIAIDPPLYSNWDTNTAPVSFTMSADAASVVGVEDLSVENVGGGNNDNIQFDGLNNSFIRNCESKNATGYHIRLDDCYRCTVEGCYVHGYYPNPPGLYAGGSSDYGVDCIRGTADSLIINNRFDRCRHALPVEYGSCGNVFAFNYVTSPVQQQQESFGALSQNDLQHGGSQWNLWEGNVIPSLSWDDVLGGSTNNAAFRECFTRYSVLLNATNQGWGFDVEVGNGGGTLVGCVNEAPVVNGSVYVPTFRVGALDQNGNRPTNYSAWAACPTCDFYPYPVAPTNFVNPDNGNNTAMHLVEPTGTNLFVSGLVLMGTNQLAPTASISWNATNDFNDYANWYWIELLTQTNTVLWTTTPFYPTNLPSSLWLAVKPAFMNTNANNSINYVWPGQGPDVSGYTNAIPAFNNFYGY